MNKILTKLLVKKEIAKASLAEKFSSERGDTNFISIIIILGIVIILVGVFIGFREQIVGVIQGVVNGFGEDSLGTQYSQTSV